jgi:hypothetical protein
MPAESEAPSAAANIAGTRRFTEARDRSDHHFDRDNRERIARAEAPSGSGRPITKLSVSDEIELPDQSRLRPHVSDTVASVPNRHESPVETPVSFRPREIPASQLRRAQAWLRYGITVHEVAQILGVDVGEIYRTLRKSGR